MMPEFALKFIQSLKFKIDLTTFATFYFGRCLYLCVDYLVFFLACRLNVPIRGKIKYLKV